MTGRLPLGDLLALAILEHGPDPASKLALRVKARGASVALELRTNPRFERVGNGRGTRWRLSQGSWEDLGREDRANPGRDDLAESLDALTRRVAELERHIVEGDRRP